MQLIVKILTCLALTAALAACQSKDKKKDITPYEGPTLRAENIETSYSDSAKIVVKLLAPLRFDYASGNLEFPEGLEIQFFDKKEVLETKLTADKGYYNKEQNLYTASGNVVVENVQQNRVLRTKILHWKPIERLVFTKEKVHIITPKDELFGIGLEALQDLSRYKIIQPTGTLAVD
ncbi:LPS export ABC transporter periplasmic protein LptC [Eisenibacter elegans]|jgi:LPS export ABC transporter protein LptC|uniref:LPS export ABC transporter periplasmic protein LptC n=1 Tax=Eisenibacter elegans TaxID=997 RepID=UPI000404B478|nr:LPS export ABC transporter periplasmic protein LptC [Eisenibacter elegans]